MDKRSGKLIVNLTVIGIILSNCELFNSYDTDLDAVDVFCTEIVLKVKSEESGKNSFNLVRNDSVVGKYSTSKSDTVIIDSGLTPNTDYLYRVDFLKDGKVVSKSDELAIHTMDTTSHEVTWYIDTLGTAGWINDCWIVNENDIWVVGYIETEKTYTYDPLTGEWQQPYNAAHWDGEKWEYMVFFKRQYLDCRDTEALEW